MMEEFLRETESANTLLIIIYREATASAILRGFGEDK